MSTLPDLANQIHRANNHEDNILSTLKARHPESLQALKKLAQKKKVKYYWKMTTPQLLLALSIYEVMEELK